MTKFSVTKNGEVLDPRLYTWDEKTKTFSSDVDGLVLDFTGVNRVTFNTFSSCTFLTGAYCTFDTGSYCAFITSYSCTFRTGNDCAFKTGSDCAFNTGYSCIFKVGDNCSSIRYDVKGVIEIPTDKKIKLNGYGIAGYTIIEEKKEIPTCNGKVVEIEGKKYKLTEIKE
jgi:hypothetical protein